MSSDVTLPVPRPLSLPSPLLPLLLITGHVLTLKGQLWVFVSPRGYILSQIPGEGLCPQPEPEAVGTQNANGMNE